MTYEKISLPSGYDWDFFFRDTFFSGRSSLETNKDHARIERLIQEALSRCTKPYLVYELFGKENKQFIDCYYGLEIHDKEKICIVFSSERGRKSAVAIFSRNQLHTAAEYFVSLVSDSEVQIDWSLYLDMLED